MPLGLERCYRFGACALFLCPLSMSGWDGLLDLVAMAYDLDNSLFVAGSMNLGALLSKVLKVEY